MEGEAVIRPEFQVHMLNEGGKFLAQEIAKDFSTLLDQLESLCGKDGRDMALVRTQLELAAFYAKRAMASKPENQERPK